MRLRFGDCVFDPDTRQLVRAGQPVPVLLVPGEVGAYRDFRQCGRSRNSRSFQDG